MTTYGPGIDQLQHAKSVSHIIITLICIENIVKGRKGSYPGAPLTNFNDREVQQRFIFHTQKNHKFRICLPKKITTFFSIPQKIPCPFFATPKNPFVFYHDPKKSRHLS